MMHSLGQAHSFLRSPRAPAQMANMVIEQAWEKRRPSQLLPARVPAHEKKDLATPLSVDPTMEARLKKTYTKQAA